MSTCKECLHYEVCVHWCDSVQEIFKPKTYIPFDDNNDDYCQFFKNKADYAPVVHCCDCIFKRENQDINNTCYLSCNKNWGLRGVVDPTDFCSYGERKGGAE